MPASIVNSPVMIAAAAPTSAEAKSDNKETTVQQLQGEQELRERKPQQNDAVPAEGTEAAEGAPSAAEGESDEGEASDGRVRSASICARAPKGLELVRRKLITKEDPHYFHKFFGTFVLLSFFYRYLYLLPTQGNLGFSADAWSIFSIGMHIALSCSSIIFRVPHKRVKGKPTLIYREYRAHAIVFSLRCLLVYLLAFVWPEAPPLLRYATVLSMHVSADLVTYYMGEPGSTTVRGKGNTRRKDVKALMAAYGSYQCIALASHLTPNARAMDLGFNTLIAIQSSAFCMTLVRKALLTWRGHAAIYTTCLLLSTAVIASSFFATPMFFVFAAAALVLRFKFGVSKYIVWALFCIAANDVRSLHDLVTPVSIVA